MDCVFSIWTRSSKRTVAGLRHYSLRSPDKTARTYSAETDLRRLVVPVRLPGKTFRAYRQGGHLGRQR